MEDRPQIILMNSNASSVRALVPNAGPCPVMRSITFAPKIEAEKGKAWECDVPALRRAMSVREEDDAVLTNWIVEAPWAHPSWHSYAITLMHLRELPDKRRTVFYLDDATHEIWVHALDPEGDREKLIRGGGGFDCCHVLSPKNFASQFIEIEDRFALERVEAAVRLICEGKLSPDSDHARCCWPRLFGDCMLKDRPGSRPPRVRGG